MINPNITALFSSGIDQQFLDRQSREAVAFFQNPLFFNLALEKEKRLNHLAGVFAQPGPRRLLLSHTLRHLQLDSPAFTTGYLAPGYFHPTTGEEAEAKAAELAGAVVVVNNNDVHQGGAAGGYIEVFNRAPETLFLAWDFDNHHWLSLSPLLAAHCDLYVPAHRDHHFPLSRYNQAITEPVATGTIQWSRQFLAARVGELLAAPRSAAPLGMHIPYPQFTYRSQVVVTLNQKIPSVGFSTPQFHERSAEERFQEWTAYKSHWVIPVLNDIPIRVFDALVTGGIPIVPESLRFLPPISEIPPEHIVFHQAADIVGPERVVAEANARFDQGGPGMVAERHRYALARHHGDQRLAQMLAYAAQRIGLRC